MSFGTFFTLSTTVDVGTSPVELVTRWVSISALAGVLLWIATITAVFYYDADSWEQMAVTDKGIFRNDKVSSIHSAGYAGVEENGTLNMGAIFVCMATLGMLAPTLLLIKPLKIFNHYVHEITCNRLPLYTVYLRGSLIALMAAFSTYAVHGAFEARSMVYTFLLWSAAAGGLVLLRAVPDLFVRKIGVGVVFLVWFITLMTDTVILASVQPTFFIGLPGYLSFNESMSLFSPRMLTELNQESVGRIQTGKDYSEFYSSSNGRQILRKTYSNKTLRDTLYAKPYFNMQGQSGFRGQKSGSGGCQGYVGTGVYTGFRFLNETDQDTFDDDCSKLLPCTAELARLPTSKLFSTGVSRGEPLKSSQRYSQRQSAQEYRDICNDNKCNGEHENEGLVFSVCPAYPADFDARVKALSDAQGRVSDSEAAYFGLIGRKGFNGMQSAEVHKAFPFGIGHSDGASSSYGNVDEYYSFALPEENEAFDKVFVKKLMEDTNFNRRVVTFEDTTALEMLKYCVQNIRCAIAYYLPDDKFGFALRTISMDKGNVNGKDELVSEDNGSHERKFRFSDKWDSNQFFDIRHTVLLPGMTTTGVLAGKDGFDMTRYNNQTTGTNDGYDRQKLTPYSTQTLLTIKAPEECVNQINADGDNDCARVNIQCDDTADMYDECESWATNGDCVSRPDFMNIFCQGSCGIVYGPTYHEVCPQICSANAALDSEMGHCNTNATLESLARARGYLDIDWGMYDDSFPKVRSACRYQYKGKPYRDLKRGTSSYVNEGGSINCAGTVLFGAVNTGVQDYFLSLRSDGTTAVKCDADTFGFRPANKNLWCYCYPDTGFSGVPSINPFLKDKNIPLDFEFHCPTYLGSKDLWDKVKGVQVVARGMALPSVYNSRAWVPAASAEFLKELSDREAAEYDEANKIVGNVWGTIYNTPAAHEVNRPPSSRTVKSKYYNSDVEISMKSPFIEGVDTDLPPPLAGIYAAFICTLTAFLLFTSIVIVIAPPGGPQDKQALSAVFEAIQLSLLLALAVVSVIMAIEYMKVEQWNKAAYECRWEGVECSTAGVEDSQRCLDLKYTTLPVDTSFCVSHNECGHGQYCGNWPTWYGTENWGKAGYCRDCPSCYTWSSPIGGTCPDYCAVYSSQDTSSQDTSSQPTCDDPPSMDASIGIAATLAVLITGAGLYDAHTTYKRYRLEDKSFPQIEETNL